MTTVQEKMPQNKPTFEISPKESDFGFLRNSNAEIRLIVNRQSLIENRNIVYLIKSVRGFYWRLTIDD
jgi:hypothetical protein